MSFGNGIEQFIRYIVTERGLARRTAESYRGDLLSAAEFLREAGAADWRDVTRDQLLDYLEERRVAGMESTTIARNLVALKMLFRYLADEELIPADVTAVMDRIQQSADPDANIIFGLGFDERLTDALRVIVIATDFPEGAGTAAAPEETPKEVARVVEKQKAAPAPEKKETGTDEDWETIWKQFFD